MPISNRPIYALIHGWWGVGKTWLAVTLPGPILYLDCERGVYDTDSIKPVELLTSVAELSTAGNDGADVTYVYPITSNDDITAARNVLMSGKHHFNSVVVDSITALQSLKKKEVQTKDPKAAYNPDETLDWQGWGRLLNHLMMLGEDLRLVAAPDHVRPCSVVLIAGCDREGPIAKPLIEGAFRKRVPGLVDLCGYMTTVTNKENKEVRVLHIQPSASIEAKCRLDRIAKKWEKGYIPNPNFREMLDVVNNIK